MIRDKILYWIVFCFAGGIAFNEWWGKTILFLTLSLAGLFLALACFIFSKKTSWLHAVAACAAVLVVAFGGGFFRNHVAVMQSTSGTEIDSFVNEKVTLVGVATEEQERRDFNTRLTIVPREINGQAIGQNIKILVTTSSPKDFMYGDLVKVTGSIIVPENFYTDTGREFDYIGYLRTNDIRFLIKNAAVTVTGHDPPSNILAGLFYVKRKFVASLGNLLPEPESSLAAGILIDGKQSINGELQEKFRKTGLVHIVVLSGSNVSIVAEAITRAFAFLPRVLGLVSASLGIVAFALITGATSTVVRASIMALLVIVSRGFLKKYDAGRGLFIASLLMLAHNPGILFYSPSFQLSFLATFAVIKIVPRCEAVCGSWLRFLPEKFGIRELVTSNIVVQLFLLPILSWMTGFVSAVSLPVNLLVLPLVPLTMLLSFLTAIAGWLSHLLGLPFAFAAHLLLSYELSVVDFFSKFSLAEIAFSGFSSAIVVGFYMLSIICSLHRNLIGKSQDFKV